MASPPPRRAEPDEPSGPSEGSARFERLRTRYDLVSDILTPQRLGLVLVALALLVVGAIGGWDAVAETSDVEEAQVGTPVEGGPFTVTVQRVRVGDELAPVERPQPGKRFLFVLLEATVTGDEPVRAALLRQELTLDAPGVLHDEGPLSYPRIHRGLDGLAADMQQPDVPTSLVMVWEQDASAPVPQTVTLTLNKLEWAASAMDGGMDWRNPEPTHTLQAPVTPLGQP